MEKEDRKRIEELLCILAQNCRAKDEAISKKIALSPAENRLLLALLNNGHMTIGNIARKMDVAASRVTRLVDSLVEENYVVRKSDPADRRRLWVLLTTKGEEIADKLSLCSKDYHEKVISSIPSSKQKQVLETLELLVSSLKKANEEGY
jgi:DNA-binding MarR family transcriptional regulator